MDADGYHSSTPLLFRVHPALINFAEECRAVFVRLMAYGCGVGALALIAADLFAVAAVSTVEVPLRSRDAWSATIRPQPAFAAPVADFANQSESYEIRRHPEGGRKDILRWSSALAGAPLSQIELYRPGAELTAFGPVASEIAARVAEGRTEAIQAAGVIESKFGPVALVGFPSQASGRTCIGFAHNFETPRLQISGWSCQGDSPQMQRQAVACALERLTMLSAGNDPKLAELFSRAELRRGRCGQSAPVLSDWVTATHEPTLRGRL
jgi:hypothetical protein